METLISPLPLLTACLLLIATVALIYTCWRTQSLHFLLRRFWQLVHGNKDIPDPQIQAFAQTQTSLYAFRLFSGTQVKSLEQAHQLIAWSQQHQVPMATISACGDCFDLEKHAVITNKLPGKLFRVALFLWLITLIFTTAGCLFMALAAPGLATLKATDRGVILNKNSARVFVSLPFVTTALDRGDCSAQYPARLQATRFTAEEIHILCDLFKNETWSADITQTKNDQRQQLLILAFITAFCFYLYFLDFNKYFHARELHKKLQHTKEPDIEQPNT